MTLKVDSIAGEDGTSPVTLTGQAAARAWVNLNGTGTVAIKDSLNTSSIVDNGTGSYTSNWSTSFSDANYGVSYAANAEADVDRKAVGISAALVGSLDFACKNVSGVNTDEESLNSFATGDLA